MLGRGLPYDRVPYFFSDQHDVSMEYVGHAPGWDRVVFRGDPGTREFAAFWLSGERVLAGMSVNIGQMADPIADLVRERVPVEAALLADPAVPLAELGRARSSRSSSGWFVAAGQGRVLDVGGEKVAVFRDDRGVAHAVSAYCTHRRCVVDWNGADRTWDCPCHGARFESDGRVIKGPAKEDLPPMPVPPAALEERRPASVAGLTARAARGAAR